jgi:hypothetical protein
VRRAFARGKPMGQTGLLPIADIAELSLALAGLTA